MTDPALSGIADLARAIPVPEVVARADDQDLGRPVSAAAFASARFWRSRPFAAKSAELLGCMNIRKKFVRGAA